MSRRLPSWADPLLLAEWSFRQVYWRSPGLRRRAQAWRRGRPTAAQAAPRAEWRAHLEGLGVTPGALVMAHTSVSGLQLVEEGDSREKPPGLVATAGRLLDDLDAALDETGTLVMPTHAPYQNDEAFVLRERRPGAIRFDPERTPTNLGMANELFRRRKGVRRSLHPVNTLSARGPLAEELLAGNLNDAKPLPHGVHSGYYRLCRRNGLVLGVGLPLALYLTVVHVAEEVRDRDWPVPDFWEERSYLVRVDGEDRPVVVRQLRPEYALFCLCMRKASRDLVADGVVHEGRVGGVRVDWARAGEVLEYCMDRSRRSTFPYFGTWAVRGLSG